jgi:hypothetical protein
MSVDTRPSEGSTPEASDTHDRPRPSIEERAARRAYIESSGRDRYDGLLRHLRAGREIQPQPRGRLSLDWHPIARRMLLAIGLGVAVYLAITWAASLVRDVTVETWQGPPGMTVQSGQQLESCPAIAAPPNPVFPRWIRYDGAVFQRADRAIPVGPVPDPANYVDSGYTLGSMRLYEVRLAGIGPPGSRLLVRNLSAPAGEVYRLVPGCS